MTDRVDRNRFKNQLIEHEALRTKAYKCPAGKLTIGVGRNLDAKGISKAEAMFLFENDIQDAYRDAATLSYFKDLDGVRQAVVLNMLFNLGLPTFRGFKRMNAALAQHDYTVAAREMLDSAWAKQVGQRSRELAQMMRTGEWRR